MRTDPSNGHNESSGLRQAARFWEPMRIWYAGILAAILLGWVTLSWPHFRGSLTPLLLWLLVFLAIANVCYCAGYLVELFIQAVFPPISFRWLRRVLWLMGMLLAIVGENYWIADEIYPHPQAGPVAAISVKE